MSMHLFYLSTHSSRQKDLDYTLCNDDYTMRDNVDESHDSTIFNTDIVVSNKDT